jgi:CheY-like chemotaxis protein
MTATRKERVLIVDDEPVNQELLEAFLIGCDYDLDFAADGAEALEKVKSFEPDLVLLDVMMPKTSGFEVCEQIKSDPATAGTMVLMVTALGELGDVERAVKVGCDDYLSKPVNKPELLKRVENMLKLRAVTNELERLRRYIDSMEDATSPKRDA